MSKAVLISIKPKWIEMIINGKKTIEVRKTAPKLETPFKCYIYCTKSHKPRFVDSAFLYYDDDLAIIHTPYGVEIRNPYGSLGKDDKLLNGTVVAEFACDEILTIDCDSVAPFCKELDRYVQKETALTAEELMSYSKYICKGWHISELKVYDQPKELSEFRTYDKFYDDAIELGVDKTLPITRPPQSWCYVEEI